MKRGSKISPLHIKRVFAMTPVLRSMGIAGLRDYHVPTLTEYLSKLGRAKARVNNMSEKELDKLRGLGTYKKRLKAYSTYSWHVASVSTKDMGAWRGAGGLPRQWTRGTLADTAKLGKKGLEDGDSKVSKRAKRAIPAIISLKKIISKDKYLFPIVFVAGTGTNGRKRYKRFKYDIDDGNMRAISLAISGRKKLNVYVGKPA